MFHARTFVSLAVGVVLAGVVLPSSPAAANSGLAPASTVADTAAGASPTAGVVPAALRPVSGTATVPSTGHLHLMSAPVRVASSVTGLRLHKGRVPALAALTLHLGGIAGLPTTGIRAVVVVVSTSAPTGATEIRLGAAASTPVLVTRSGTTSAFAIVPLTSGAVVLRNGAHATYVSVDVVGWFASVSQPGRAGLFRAVQAAGALSVIVPARSSRSLVLLGAQGVPRSGTAAVLARVTATSIGTGTVAVNAGGTAAGTAVSLAYRAGSTADLTLVRAGAKGVVVVRNSGTRSVKVTLDARGWFTNGLLASAYGDALRLATPYVALRYTTTGTGGRTVASCGLGRIPAETVSRPASFVLARTLTGPATRTAALSADPASAHPFGLPQLQTRTISGSAGLLLLQPDAACRTRIGTTAGTARTTIEPYAWFSGALVLSPHLKLLSATTLATITDLTDTSITFTGPASSLPALQVGDILSAGIAATTPSGLLRTVLTVTPTAGSVSVTTEDASLGQAITQGSLTVHGASPTAALAVAKSTAAPANRIRAQGLTPECSVGSAPLCLGLTLSCAASVGVDGVWSGEVHGSLGLGADIDLDLPPWGSGAHMRTEIGIAASAGASVTASVPTSISFSQKYLDYTTNPMDFQLGPIPVVYQFVVSTSASVSGTTSPMTGGVTVGATARSVSDSTLGSSSSAVPTADGYVTATDPENASVSISVSPFKVSSGVKLYGAINLSVGLGPTGALNADACRWWVSVAFGYSASLSISTFPGGPSIGTSLGFPLGKIDLAAHNWRNCAIWSGTMSHSFTERYFNNLGQLVVEGHGSSAVTLDPVTAPPALGLYPVHISGSGAEIEYQYGGCPPDFDQAAVMGVWTSTWAGDVSGFENVRFSIAPSSYDGFLLVTGRAGGTIPGSTKLETCGQSSTGDAPWPSRFYMLPVDGAAPPTGTTMNDQFAFPIVPGLTSFSGSRTVLTPKADNSWVNEVFTYSLTKTCTMGGADC